MIISLKRRKQRGRKINRHKPKNQSTQTHKLTNSQTLLENDQYVNNAADAIKEVAYKNTVLNWINMLLTETKYYKQND